MGLQCRKNLGGGKLGVPDALRLQERRCGECVPEVYFNVSEIGNLGRSPRQVILFVSLD